MKFSALCLFSSLFLSSADDEMPLVKLEGTDNYPDPLCLDGTPGAYYIHNNGGSKWQLYFEGGGWCYNDKDCFNRCACAGFVLELGCVFFLSFHSCRKNIP